MSEFKSGGYVTGSDMEATVVNVGEWVITHQGCAHARFLEEEEER